MTKKAGIIFVSIGAVLFLSALLLFLYNEMEDRRAGQQAELLMSEIHSAMAEESEKVEEETQSEEMHVVMIDGYEYIGFLSIPDLGLNLPVMAEWDDYRLTLAPCRHYGSAQTDDLVIAAHNYRSHFGLLHQAPIGGDVIFTDLDGVENQYTLEMLKTLPPDAVDEVLNSEYDLVMYTCTPGGATRVVAFCNRVTENMTE